jgi:hypothetical protein
LVSSCGSLSAGFLRTEAYDFLGLGLGLMVLAAVLAVRFLGVVVELLRAD